MACAPPVAHGISAQLLRRPQLALYYFLQQVGPCSRSWAFAFLAVVHQRIESPHLRTRRIVKEAVRFAVVLVGFLIALESGTAVEDFGVSLKIVRCRVHGHRGVGDSDVRVFGDSRLQNS